VPLRRITSRPELLLVLGLIGVVAVLPDGLPLGIVGIGVVSGSLLALHAIGIVLLYSRTRVLSFAQFGLGIGSAVLFYVWVLHTQFAVLAEGVCRCLAPDGSGLGDLQHNPDPFREYLLATKPWVVVVNLLLSGLLGVVLAADTGRQAFLWIAALFGRAPRIVPTIATLAFAVMLGGAASLLTLRTEEILGRRPFGWFPYGAREGSGIEGRPALPEGTFASPFADVVEVELEGGARFQLYQLLVVAVALLSLAYVVRRFERGRRGLASRATAADAERAATLGVDVITESKGPWKVAGALSGLAGCLSVGMSQTLPAVGIDMYSLTLVLAAVVLARMTSPAWALVYSVLLGVLNAGLFWNQQTTTYFEGGLVVLVGVALLLQRGRVSRAERASESVFTTAPEPLPVPRALRVAPGVNGLLRGTVVVVVGALVGYPLIASPGQLSLGVTVVGLMVLGLSLLVVSGWAGQVSLGQLALGAVGAWVTTLAGGGWGVPLPLALLLGAAAGAVVAPIVGLPAIRLPGPFVAIMTLAFALAVPAVLLNADLLGEVVPATMDRPVLLGIDLGSDRYYYWLSLLVLAGALAVVAGLRRSRLRRALIAARDNDQAVAAFGVDVTRLRLEAFAVSGLLAGLGGGMLAYANGGVQADTFSATNSVVLFLIVVIGGLVAVSGPLLGAVVFGLVQLAGAFWLGLLQGLGTVVVLAVRPAGLAGVVFGLRDAAIRVIMHLQGSDLVRLAGRRVPLADRGAQAAVVPVQYRLVGDGYGPVEGTRLRAVEGVAATGVPSVEEQVEEALGGVDLGTAARLSCHRLEVAYGGATALAGVSVDVAAGEVLAVVGLNGAGKTSFLRALVGLEPAAHGTVEVDGTDVTTWFPQVRAGLGMAFVPGGAAVLATLTVRDNLLVAGGDDASIAEVTARFPALAQRLETAAGNLSGGEQQVLAVAQAVLRRPRILLVDELSLGLSPEALAEVLLVVQELAAAGTAVVLVEQSISTAMTIADTALFLESGRVRYQGPASALRDHPELFASVAFGAGGAVAGAAGGGSELSRARQSLQLDREPVLVVEGLTAAYGDVRVVDGVTLDVAAGEVIGILGPNGAGKTSLFDALSGLLRPSEGTVTLLGEDITSLPPHARAGRGLMRSFQSGRLFPSLTVRDCIAVALETRLTTRSAAFAGLWLPPARAEERRVEERVGVLLELLRLEAVADTPVGSLSLGSRRMVDLACQLAARPKVLLLDEPASGLAAGETELLGPLVSRISSDLGCAVLIIEHNVAVLASVAHRLVAMQAGAVIAEGAPGDVLADPVVRSAYFGAGGTDPALVTTS
jgi:ABC-type branched-subunit amino acid transport system ATPase component/ABC-type branched-subunit amino acid transport system permease subunit